MKFLIIAALVAVAAADYDDGVFRFITLGSQRLGQSARLGDSILQTSSHALKAASFAPTLTKSYTTTVHSSPVHTSFIQPVQTIEQEIPVYSVQREVAQPVFREYSVQQKAVQPALFSQTQYSAKPLLNQQYSAKSLLNQQYSAKPLLNQQYSQQYSAKSLLNQQYSAKPLLNQQYSAKSLLNQQYTAEPLLNQQIITKSLSHQQYAAKPLFNQQYSAKSLLNQQYTAEPLLNQQTITKSLSHQQYSAVAKSDDSAYATAYSGPQYRILSQIQEVDPAGPYKVSFDTENGIHSEEEGALTAGAEGAVVAAKGSYAYTGPDGVQYTVNYIADENGFRAAGDHLPTPPPIPAEILRSLEENAHSGEQYDDQGLLRSLA